MPDEVWDQAARHDDEPQLAALVVAIAAINAFNRVNAATRQITGDYVADIVKRLPEPPPEQRRAARRTAVVRPSRRILRRAVSACPQHRAAARARVLALIGATLVSMVRRLVAVGTGLLTWLALVPADALARAGGGSHSFGGGGFGGGGFGGGSRGRGFGGGRHFFFFGGGGGGSLLLIIVIVIIVVVLFLAARSRGGGGRGRRGR